MDQAKRDLEAAQADLRAIEQAAREREREIYHTKLWEKVTQLEAKIMEAKRLAKGLKKQKQSLDESETSDEFDELALESAEEYHAYLKKIRDETLLKLKG